MQIQNLFILTNYDQNATFLIGDPEIPQDQQKLLNFYENSLLQGQIIIVNPLRLGDKQINILKKERYVKGTYISAFIFMKIYSLIDEKKSGNYEENFDREQYTFNQFPNRNSNGSVFAEKSQRSSREKSKNKYSFRLQPQLYFQKKRNNLEQIYEAVNHISIVDSEDERKVQKQQRKLSPYNRRKIFDGSIPITKLNSQKDANFSQENDKVKVRNPKTGFPPQANSHIQPITQISNINANLPNLSSLPLSTLIASMNPERQQRKLGQIVNFSHPQSETILQNPILQEAIRQDHKNLSVSPNIERIIKQYPRLIQKVESTQKQLKQLSKKIEQKSEEQKKMMALLQKTIEEKNIANLQKDKQIYQYKKYIGNLTQQNVNKKLKAELQIEQHKRLQQLIHQNKFLCSKVIEQQQHRVLKREQEQVNKRINQLRQQRNNKYQQILSKNTNKNIKQAQVPFHILEQKPFNRIRNPGSSSITFNQRPSTFNPNNNTMPVPERDFGEITRIRTRQIPFSKIY